jgi:hypothetical protein
MGYTYASPPVAPSELWFSDDVAPIFGVASFTNASTTEMLLLLTGGTLTASDTAFYPGSSTIRISPHNQKIKDHSGRKANGTTGEYPADAITIRAN